MAQEIFDRIQKRRKRLQDSFPFSSPETLAELRALNWVIRLYYEHKASCKRKVLVEKTKKKRKKAGKGSKRAYLMGPPMPIRAHIGNNV